MSDEFIKVGKEELNNDLNQINKILDKCRDDNDIMLNASDIEKKIHNIKGLSPMVGFEDLGKLFANLDKLFKHMLDGKKITGIFSIVRESNIEGQKSINNESSALRKINQKIETEFSQFLD